MRHFSEKLRLFICKYGGDLGHTNQTAYKSFVDFWDINSCILIFVQDCIGCYLAFAKYIISAKNYFCKKAEISIA